ncbi:MAG TPA: acyltransferase domain-containing protein, partial [Nannocystis sp.]
SSARDTITDLHTSRGTSHAHDPDASHPVSSQPATSLILPISARTAPALRTLAAAYRDRLRTANVLAADLCAAAALRRAHLEHRLAITGSTAAELITALDAYLADDLHPGWTQHGPGERPRLAFVFAGHSGHWVGMGRSLYAQVPVFRAALDACATALARHRDGSLIDDLHATDERWASAEVLQPLVLALEVALAELWSDWGVLPQAVVGHSMGELAAACVCGALSLADAFRICVHRSRLIDSLRGRGAMASVALSLAAIDEHLAPYRDRVAVAAANSPQLTVISGDPAAVRELCDALSRKNIFTRPMRDATTAGHSPQLDPLLPELAAALTGLTSQPARVPFHSTVTAGPLAGESLGPDYWLRNLREPVRFTQTIAGLGESGLDAFLEIGPNPLLLGAIEQTLRPRGGALTRLGSLKADAPELPALHATLARLFVLGLDLEWSRIFSKGSRAVDLPAYPWQRQRHWLAVATPTAPPSKSGLGQPVIAARAPHDRFWELRHADTAPVLHIQGLPLLPIARPLELALAAARHLSPGTDTSLAAIGLTPTTLAETLDLQLIADDPAGPRRGFELHARGPTPRLLASGRIDPPRATTLDPRHTDALATIQQRCASASPTLRATLCARGLELASNLWAVDHASTGPARELLASVADAATPAILESALHLLASLVHEPGAAPVDGELFLPHAIDHLWHAAKPAPIAWIHATLRGATGPSFGGTGDLRLLDITGRPVASLTGVHLQPLAPGLARQ